MNAAQIKHMVDRFLWWRLPENFSPDCGIQFDADAAKNLDPRNLRYEPVGTNLFDATQADAMVRHMIDGMPENPPVDDAAAKLRRVEAFLNSMQYENDVVMVGNVRRVIAGPTKGSDTP